jgi:hypothetical protein
LTVAADIGLIIDKALCREARRTCYALYLLQTRLYLEALWLKCARFLLDFGKNLCR